MRCWEVVWNFRVYFKNTNTPNSARYQIVGCTCKLCYSEYIAASFHSRSFPSYSPKSAKLLLDLKPLVSISLGALTFWLSEKNFPSVSNARLQKSAQPAVLVKMCGIVSRCRGGVQGIKSHIKRDVWSPCFSGFFHCVFEFLTEI